MTLSTKELSAELDDLIQFSVRAIRDLASGALSLSSAGRLKGLWKGERFIKNIGAGGTQIADLVLHPKFGVSIRKHAKTGIMNPSTVSESAKYLMKAQKKIGPSGFARVHSVEPGGLSYHEYVPGPTMSDKKRRSWDYINKELERVDMLDSDEFVPTQKDLFAHSKKRKHPQYDRPSPQHVRLNRLQRVSERLSQKPMPATPEQKVMIKHLEGKGLTMDDLHRRNIIGNKIIDYTVEDPNTIGDNWTSMGDRKKYPSYRVFKKRSTKQLSSLIGNFLEFKQP